MSNRIPVFYDPRQNCDSVASFSPSAGKPAKVIQDWLDNEKIAHSIEIMPVEPVSRETLYRAHARGYVDGVLNLHHPNGFGTKNKPLADSLPFTVGSMVSAVKHVLTHDYGDNRYKAAVSPTSGFHHAGHGFGGGYCTFNGLVVAAIQAHDLGAKRVLILDFDQHYGNGTEDIIKRLGLGYIAHVTAEKSYDSADSAFEVIQNTLAHVNEYDLVLYQAGADCHVDDPLGGIMTSDQMLARDHLIFTKMAAASVPIVWNLAGGYQRDANGGIEPVLELHRQTIKECIKWSFY